MYLTFQMMTLDKYLTNNFKSFLGGTPIFARRSPASPKITTSALLMTPLFYCRILFYSKKGMFAKKKMAPWGQ